jgi:hypothetical protein
VLERTRLDPKILKGYEMRNSNGKRNWLGLLIVCVALGAGAVLLPLLSSAKSRSAATTSISVVNNSSREIRHLYLAAADQDNWGPDQLNETVLRTGDSFVLNNVTCSGGQVKVVSEDKDGCFLSTVVSCATDAAWTITNDATPNCGN